VWGTLSLTDLTQLASLAGFTLSAVAEVNRVAFVA
jgi:hypothetical protein